MESDAAALEKPHLCELCPKRYLRKNNLEDHVLMEHPDSDQIKIRRTFASCSFARGFPRPRGRPPLLPQVKKPRGRPPTLARARRLPVPRGRPPKLSRGRPPKLPRGRPPTLPRGQSPTLPRAIKTTVASRTLCEGADAIILHKSRNGRSKASLIIECDICSKKFRYQSDLKNHHDSHFRSKGRKSSSQPIPDLNSTTPLSSRRCSRPQGKGDIPMARRVRGGSDGFVPPTNFAKPPMPSTPNGHFSTVVVANNAPRPCRFCGKQLATWDELKQHEFLESQEYERQACRYDAERRLARVHRQLDLKTHNTAQVIDRTGEEFGGPTRTDDFTAERGRWSTNRAPNGGLCQVQNQNAVGPGHSAHPGPGYHVYPHEPENYFHTVPNGEAGQYASPAISASHTYYAQLRMNSSNGHLAGASQLQQSISHDTSTISHGLAKFSSSRDEQCHNVSECQSSPFPGGVQYNHTSQYVGQDPAAGGGLPPSLPPPPPAHEDHEAFLPPPPPLPVPQFSQGCHSRTDMEFTDPNEERTYTRLQSKDESQTCSSLLHVNSMSPSREVLDLSLRRTDGGQAATGESDVKNGSPFCADKDEAEKGDVPKSMDLDEKSPSGETNGKLINGTYVDTPVASNGNAGPLSAILESPSLYSKGVNGNEANYSNSQENGFVCFEPTTMDDEHAGTLAAVPNKSSVERFLDGPSSEEMEEMNEMSEEEWKALTDEYTEFFNNGRQGEESTDGLDSFTRDAMSRRSSTSPLLFDDPNRIDCRFCGMLFDAPHVRKFHEASHEEDLQEYEGENTRLFCGFCGKSFKKVAYRILHEKGHTGDLSVACSYCNRKFRWESELKSHHRLQCSPNKPALPQTGGGGGGSGGGSSSRNRHKNKDDWVYDETLPAGWKMRSRPRPNQEGQVYFMFLSPDGIVFHSRRAVLSHMEKEGGYSKEELEKVYAYSRTGPRSAPFKRSKLLGSSSSPKFSPAKSERAHYYTDEDSLGGESEVAKRPVLAASSSPSEDSAAVLDENGEGKASTPRRSRRVNA